MAKTSREYAIALLWKKNEGASVNYGKSIGIQNGYESDGFTVHADKIIDFEEGTFYSPPERDGISFYSNYGSDVNLKVNGNVETNELKVGNVTLKTNYSEDKLLLSKTFNGVESTVNIELKEEGGTVATQNQLNAIKKDFVYDKSALTAFLEIMKEVPALENKRAEIENLIESI